MTEHAQDATKTTPAGPQHRYTAHLAGQIEAKWQEAWERRGTFRQPNPGEAGFDPSRPKFYCLDMFPYPSGAGLHVGHPEGYTATDILCRYKKMRGCNVLHPMGWDAFGLPAEQYAIQTGVHPAITTRKSINNFRRQLQRFGFCYDWSREFATIDEDYYKWTQWIFLRLHDSWFDPSACAARPVGELLRELESGALAVDAGGGVAPAGKAAGLRAWSDLDANARREVIDGQRLAYIGEQTVNWCPKLGTALANEEVIDGRSERGGHPVFRKPLRQWMLRITAYAERLLEGLDSLDWPASTKAQQAEWIGRSEGAEIEFRLETPLRTQAGEIGSIRVFTTRPDTIFGATYMVVAPEHPLVDAALEAGTGATPSEDLRAYATAARNRSDVERQESKDKTGVFTGLRAINPATGEAIGVWTSDYVLMGYGFGAVMAVPAHDERDFEFAKAMDLPIRDVVYPRPLHAAWWYASRASEDERLPERFMAALADFVGAATGEGVEASKYGVLLQRMRGRRPPGERADDAQAERGAMRETWSETFRDLGLDGLDAVRDRLLGGKHYALAGEAFSDSGVCAHATGNGVSLDGLSTGEAKRAIVAWLESTGAGRRRVNYKLRDWLFSRQRYWGEPFPIVFDERGGRHAVRDEALPVRLPEMADYKPVESEDPQPLLAKAGHWVQTTAGEAGVDGLSPDAPVMRETNTMPGWAGSCWYHLRYCDPTNSERLVGEEAERYWLGPGDGEGAQAGGVDLYIGGAEHAVLHLLYARFWHKVLFDLGVVSSDEPYRKLYHQGLILSHAFQRADKTLVAIDQVENRGSDDTPEWVETATGEPVRQIVAKMSKSLRNVVNPDDVIDGYGADTFRLYEMYMGPLDASKPWNTRDIAGLLRFCQRAWRMVIDEDTGEAQLGETPDADLEKRLHRLIAKVGEDYERLAFNTAIAAMIEFVNASTAAREKSGTLLTADQARRFALTLCPSAPHLGEELWARTGGAGLASEAAWPVFDEAMLVDDAVEIAIQIAGKVRHRMEVPAQADAKALETMVLADAKVQDLLDGKTVRKVIVVPGRMVNIVAT